MNVSSVPNNESRKMVRNQVTLLLAAVLIGGAGCLSRPALVHQSFAFQAPPGTNVSNVQASHVLALRTIEVSPLFEGRSLTYRTGQDSYELDAYSSLLVVPNRALVIPLRAYFRDSGLFRDVVDAGSPIKADTLLDAHVSELYGDFSQSDQPAAVLSVRFLFFRNGQNGAELVFQKMCTRRAALQEKTAAAVVAGWDRALAEIMGEITGELAKALGADGGQK
jgi:ABC-type uncharacterized transport system auxiliary subunit